ncbi:hypothetical protein D3C75_1075790 [compost metagenome]
MDLVRMSLRAGRNGIQPGLQRLELFHKLPRTKGNPELLQHIDELTSPQPLLQFRLVVAFKELAQPHIL